MPESVGAVSLELQADASKLLNHIQSIAGQISDMIGNSVSKSFSVTNTNNVDLSGVTSILNTISGKIDGFISAGMTKGATEGAEAVKAAVTNAVSDIKMPTIKVAMSKEDLQNQLKNMLDSLELTIDKSSLAAASLKELERQWAGMGQKGTQDSTEGLALQKKILSTREELISLEGKMNQFGMKANAVEAAINNFGADGKKDVQKVTEAATMTEKKIDAVGTSATQASKKVDKIGDAGQSAGKKAASGISKIVRELTSAGKSAGASGLEHRLSKIEHATQKTMRSVTALGRRFFVLFTGKMISAAFAGVSDSLEDASKSSDQLNKSMGTLTGAGKTVSNGVITAIAPLINFVAPTLGSISEKIRVFSNQVAMFIATILGQDTVMQAAAASYDGMGASATGAADAAAKANKTLAGFDTLNILSSKKDSSGGSGSGSGSDTVFEEVPLKNNKWAEDLKSRIQPILDAFDRAKPAFEEFYKTCLEPFGTWVVGEGIPNLIDFLGDVAQFFVDNPNLTGTIGILAANLALLAPFGAKGIAIAVTIAGSIGIAEWLTQADFESNLKTVFETATGKNGFKFDVADFIQFWFDADRMTDAFDTGIFSAVATVQQTFKNAFQLLGANISLWWTDHVANPFITGFNSVIDGWNQILTSMGFEPMKIKIDPIDTTGLKASIVQLENELKYGAVTASAAMNKEIKNGTNTALQTYGGMPYDVAQKLEAYKAVVAQKSLDTGNIMSYTAGVYKGHTVGVYDALSAETRAKMGLYSNYAKVGGQDAGNYLADGTKVGTSNAQEFVRKYVNNTATYLAANANNTIDSVASQQSTFAGIPFAIQQKLGLVWGAWNKPAKISFPAFANGAFLRANQPQLAIVGDNRTEGEFVAPESKLQEAVAIGIQKAAALFSHGQPAAVAEGNITIIIGDEQITDYVMRREKRIRRRSNK